MFYHQPIDKQTKGNRSKVYKVGINDAPYKTQIKINNKRYTCPFYTKWKNMLERVYSKAYHAKQPTYKNCTVCDEWHTFSLFKHWMNKQAWKNKQLDKDILHKNNKHYSPEHCIFVSHKINSLMQTHRMSTQGIYLDKTNPNNVRYVAHTNNKHLGQFDSFEKAAKVRNLAQSHIMLNIVEIEPQPKLKLALWTHARDLRRR